MPSVLDDPTATIRRLCFWLSATLVCGNCRTDAAVTSVGAAQMSAACTEAVGSGHEAYEDLN